MHSAQFTVRVISIEFDFRPLCMFHLIGVSKMFNDSNPFAHDLALTMSSEQSAVEL